MPHIIVMHSAKDRLDMPKLLHNLHASLSSHESVNIAQVKTYDIPLPHYIVGDNTKPDDMIHIQVRMKHGRSEDVRTDMAKKLHDVAREQADAQNFKCGVSVEIHELHDASYQSSYSE